MQINIIALYGKIQSNLFMPYIQYRGYRSAIVSVA